MKGLTHMSETIAQMKDLWYLIAAIGTALMTAIVAVCRGQWRDDQQEKQLIAIQKEHDLCKATTQKTLSDIHGRVSNIEGKLDIAIVLIERRNGARHG